MTTPDLSYARSLKPAEAIAYFQAKGYQITRDWHESWLEAHAKAFTVAKVTKLDLLQDIREAVDKAIASGATLADFRREMEPIMKAKGWWGRENYLIPTLKSPYEIWLTLYDDGAYRKRYVGLFTGKRDLLCVIRENKDGSLIWNIMQAHDKSMNKKGEGVLIYGK